MNKRQIDPARFNKQCAAIIAKFVEKRDELVWVSNGVDKVTYTCKNKLNPIYAMGTFLLRVTGSSSLFVHCDLTYKSPYQNASKNKEFTFQGISIQFFHGAKFCFCRAEWDVKDKPEKLVHPQPHWHWGGKQSIVSFDDEARFEVVDNLFHDDRMPNINFSELHYAMSAKWLEKGENNLDFSFQNLTKWLGNTLVMVIDQYNYQVNKKDFVSIVR